MHTFTLHIQTPKECFVHEGIAHAHLPGASGAMGMRANHAPMVVQLASGVLHVRQKGQTNHYFINPGMAHISKEKCLILTEKSQKLDDLDPRILQEQLESYHDDLAGMELDYEQRFIEREIRITRAMLHAVNDKKD